MWMYEYYTYIYTITHIHLYAYLYTCIMSHICICTYIMYTCIFKTHTFAPVLPGTPRHKDTQTQSHRETKAILHRHTNTQTQTHRHKHTDTQKHRYTNTQTHRHADTQTERERPLWYPRGGGHFWYGVVPLPPAWFYELASSWFWAVQSPKKAWYQSVQKQTHWDLSQVCSSIRTQIWAECTYTVCASVCTYNTTLSRICYWVVRRRAVLQMHLK